ncbi:MAG: type sorting protein [Bacteroidota bacterium]|nr:type sorting protein [Bacteroidota bacterium]
MSENSQNLEKYFKEARSQQPLLDADDARSLLESVTTAGTSNKLFKLKKDKGISFMNILTASLAAGAAIVIFSMNFFSSGKISADKPAASVISSITENSNDEKQTEQSSSDETIENTNDNTQQQQAQEQPQQQHMQVIIKQISISETTTDAIPDNSIDSIFSNSFNPATDVRGVNLIELDKNQLAKLGITITDDGNLKYWDAYGKKPMQFTVLKTGGVMFNLKDTLNKPDNLPNFSPRLITDNEGYRRVAVFKDNENTDEPSLSIHDVKKDKSGNIEINSNVITTSNTPSYTISSTNTGKESHKSAAYNFKLANMKDLKKNKKFSHKPGFDSLVIESRMKSLDSICKNLQIQIVQNDSIINGVINVKIDSLNKCINKSILLSSINDSTIQNLTEMYLGNAENLTDNDKNLHIYWNLNRDSIFENNYFKFDTLTDSDWNIDNPDTLDWYHNQNDKLFQYDTVDYFSNPDIINLNKIKVSSILLDSGNISLQNMYKNMPNAMIFHSGKNIISSDVSDSSIYITDGFFKNDRSSAIFQGFDEEDAKINRMVRVNKLVPIIIHTGKSSIGIGSGKGFAYILWFEPNQDFIELLPLAVQQKILPEVEAIRESGGECMQQPLKGEEPVFDVWRACAGAIEKLTLQPNPAHSQVEVNFTLAEAREAAISLHDLFGRRLKELSPVKSYKTGEYSNTFQLQELEPGLYLIVVRTEKNEQAVQRLIVE